MAPIDKLSVVFVALLGTALLGEELSAMSWFGVVLIGVGAVVCRAGVGRVLYSIYSLVYALKKGTSYHETNYLWHQNRPPTYDLRSNLAGLARSRRESRLCPRLAL
ncbi:MAG: hypothetical protein R2932_58860 [Caldilineaceae bacterium]